MNKNLYSTDLEARIAELEEELEEHGALDEAEQAELDGLKDARDEVGKAWGYGITFVHEDNFTEYAEELADDTCEVTLHQWPYSCIDWKEAASELRHDFTSITINGEDYLYQE